MNKGTSDSALRIPHFTVRLRLNWSAGRIISHIACPEFSGYVEPQPASIPNPANLFMSRPTLVILAVFLAPAWSVAIEPAELVLIANRRMPGSVEVARRYCELRKVPAENLLILELPVTEDITRSDYQQKLVVPVRAFLKGRKEKAKVLLSVYGVPLRVGGSATAASDQAELATVAASLKTTRARLKEVQARLTMIEADAKKDPKGAAGQERTTLDEERKKLAAEEKRQDGRHRWLTHAESQAAVDSELMLLWWDSYELRRFLPNPLHAQYPAEQRKGQAPVMMTARLDGPTAAIAQRLVEDALAVEAQGLRGKVYIDSRGIRYDSKAESGYGYGGYDESMRETARLLQTAGKMDVILDDRNELFAPGSCPECALYCGWYSHAKFIDSNRFVRGAIAWHLASSEAVSLRRPDQTLWCRNILEKGAAVTLGPVAEPYTVGFPKPAEFFGYLCTGELTLVECYMKSLPLTSWMTTLIGDPLYCPFRANKRLKMEQVSPSPKGGRYLAPR